MIYLCIAVLASTGTFFGMRYTESHHGNRYVATVFTFIVCTILSYLIMDEKVLFYNSSEGLFALLLAVFNGICMTAGMLVIRSSTGKNGTPMTTTFSKLGVLIPTIVSIVLFSEIPTMIQMVGIVLAVFAIVMINRSGDAGVKDVKLLMVVLIVRGTADLNTKLFDIYGDPAMKELFTFYTFFICMIISFVIMLVKDRNMTAGDIIAGSITGIPNQMGLYFALLAVSRMPAYAVFPILSAGVILAVSIINYLVFKEKPSRQEKYAMLIIAASLVLINI